jgi:predicted alpha/beta superfamily hydrolase
MGTPDNKKSSKVYNGVEIMKGTIRNLTIDGFACSLYLPQDYCDQAMHYPVIYMNGGDNIPEIMRGVESHFGVDCKSFLLLNVQPGNWNDDYTPWPATALTKDSEPFGGCAATYLSLLAHCIKPFMDAHYKTKQEPENTALIGYSLGGLAALYALYTSATFGKIGSLSGSLWFEGWKEFMHSNMPVDVGSRVYLSLGKGEELSRNQRMAKVGDCTRTAAELLSQQLVSVDNLKLEWNNGGHFTEIPQRYQRALLWLMQTEKRDL